MKITNKTLDKIIELFCVANDETGVWGMDTELFETRQGARDALKKILKISDDLPRLSFPPVERPLEEQMPLYKKND